MREQLRGFNQQLKTKLTNTTERMLGPIWWKAIQSLPRDVSGVENLEAMQESLEKQSCLIPYNHLAIQDAMVICDVVANKLDTEEVKFTVPASIKFWDGSIGFPGARGTMELLRNEKRIDFVKVVQHYDQRYSREEKNSINEEMISRITTVLSQPGSVVPFSPEGGRSKTGQMEYAKKGIEKIMGNSPQETLILPAAIHGQEKVMPYGSIIPRPFHTTHVSFGEPMTVKEAFTSARLLNVEPRDYLMLKLTDGLPREYWGVYNEANFAGYFGGR